MPAPREGWKNVRVLRGMIHVAGELVNNMRTAGPNAMIVLLHSRYIRCRSFSYDRRKAFNFQRHTGV